MSYQKEVSTLIRNLADGGLKQREIANIMGFPNRNVVSQHLSETTSPLPLKRLRSLTEANHLDAIKTLELIRQRSKNHPTGATEMDIETTDWMLRTTARAVDLHAARKSAASKGLKSGSGVGS